MKEDMQDKMVDTRTAAQYYENTAASEAKYDAKLAEHTKAVAAKLRARAEYIKSRIDG